METSPLINQVFGDHLRSARKAVQLTQEELAFRAELDRTYISLLERGMKSPTLTTFFRLCSVLDLQPDLFLARIHKEVVAQEQERSHGKEDNEKGQ